VYRYTEGGSIIDDGDDLRQKPKPLDDSAGMDWTTTVGVDGLSHLTVELRHDTNVGVRVKVQFEDEFTAPRWGCKRLPIA
jgi:hypothetical protein